MMESTMTLTTGQLEDLKRRLRKRAHAWADQQRRVGFEHTNASHSQDWEDAIIIDHLQAERDKLKAEAVEVVRPWANIDIGHLDDWEMLRTTVHVEKVRRARTFIERHTPTTSGEPQCRCHARLGNDFWFLPAGKCLYGDGCQDRPASGDPVQGPHIADDLPGGKR